MIRRKTTTVFLDLKENCTVSELKKMIEGITKVSLKDLQLYKDDNGQYSTLDDEKILSAYGFTSNIAKAQAPATIVLTFRQEDGNFETPLITPLSSPPELPDVMKTQEINANEQATSSSF
ncbi:unnamed protein product [Gordionus sp. m RMFG-2023]